MKHWQVLLLGILLGLGIALVVHAQTTTEYFSNPLSTDNVLYKPNPAPDYSQPASQSPKYVGDVQPVSGTSIRNTGSISEQTIRLYLESKKSPLAPYSALIAASPYSGTILGICTIEQYGCARAPSISPYNFWGIMRPGGGLARYSSYEEGISAINTWLAAHEATHPTVQSLNGYYVVPASSTWLATVLKTKLYLETYETQ